MATPNIFPASHLSNSRRHGPNSIISSVSPGTSVRCACRLVHRGGLPRARHCEKSSERIGSPGAGAMDDRQGPVGTSQPSGDRDERKCAALLTTGGSQRCIAREDRHLGAASSPLRGGDDLSEAATGRRAHQPQAGGTTLHAREAASTAQTHEEDPPKGRHNAGKTLNGPATQGGETSLAIER